MNLLDEKALRRSDFTDGTPVMLADGQEWTFPFVDSYFTIDGDSGRRHFNMGPEYDELMTLLDLMTRLDSNGDDSLAALATRLLAPARYLLLRNYNLMPDQVAEILRIKFGVEDSADPLVVILRELRAVIWGNVEAPKQSAVV